MTLGCSDVEVEYNRAHCKQSAGTERFSNIVDNRKADLSCHFVFRLLISMDDEIYYRQLITEEEKYRNVINNESKGG